MSYNIRQQNAERRLRHSRWAHEQGRVNLLQTAVMLAVAIFIGFAIAAQF